jgi:hypothetical protein
MWLANTDALLVGIRDDPVTTVRTLICPFQTVCTQPELLESIRRGLRRAGEDLQSILRGVQDFEDWRQCVIGDVLDFVYG